MAERRRNVRELERKARKASDALTALLEPSGRRGSVLGDLLYRAEHRAIPDGFPSSSAAAAPALTRPTSQQGLRTTPEDALRRKREPGYAEGSSVEMAVESLVEDVCEKCGGQGEHGILTARGPEKRPCEACGGTGRRYHDPVSEAVDDLVAALDEVARLTHRIDKKRQIVLHARDAAPSNVRPERCRGCHRVVECTTVDPIRRGLCGSCRVAYDRWRIDNGTNDESGDRARWCSEIGPTRRHEGHDERLCDQCAENRRKAGDDWRLDRADEMRRPA